MKKLKGVFIVSLIIIISGCSSQDWGSYVSPADLNIYGPDFKKLNLVSDKEYPLSEGMTFRVFGKFSSNGRSSGTLSQVGKYNADFRINVDLSQMSQEGQNKVIDEWDGKGVIIEGYLDYPGQMTNYQYRTNTYEWERVLVAKLVTFVCEPFSVYGSSCDDMPVRQ